MNNSTEKRVLTRKDQDTWILDDNGKILTVEISQKEITQFLKRLANIVNSSPMH